MHAHNKVGFIITDLEVGGAELALERYIGYLQTAGADVFVCSLKSSGPVGQRLCERGVPVIPLGMNAHNFPLGLIHLVRLLRSERPATVCSMMFHANVAARLTRLLAPTPVLVSMERTMRQHSWLQLALDRMTVALADRVVAVSPAVRLYAIERLGVPDKKVEVIPNGVDVSRLSHLPDPLESRSHFGFDASDLVITCVANFRPVKGHCFLIQAFEQVHKEHPAARLLLIGDGIIRDQLQQSAASLGVSSRVKFAGELQDIRYALAASSVFVMPSLTEGMSNAILEALAAGIPVVATSVGGNTDLIRDGENALLVPPSDIKALAAAILRLARNPIEAERLGRNARASVSIDHSLERERQLIIRTLIPERTSRMSNAIPA